MLRIRCAASGAVLFGGLALIALFLGACRSKTAVREADVARITVEEVKERLDSGEAIMFVDSRSSGSWEAAVAKIPGSLRMPPDEAGKYISDLPKGNPVVVYCT